VAFLSACQAHTVRCGCTWCIDDVSCLLLAFQSCVTTWCSHVAKAVSSCFAVLRQLRSIQRSVSDPVLPSLVVALVLTKLDYGSATSAGLPAIQRDRLQLVLNAAARLIYRRHKFGNWPFCSSALSLPGSEKSKNFCAMELSHLWNFAPQERMFQELSFHGTLHPWNLRSTNNFCALFCSCGLLAVITATRACGSLVKQR